MDERKIYSFIVTIVCFALMALIILGVAIYTWITGGFDRTAEMPPAETAIVETANNSE